jgi:hypothetical protein
MAARGRRKLEDDPHYEYDDNSCYVDSLLMPIFFSKLEDIRANLLGAVVSTLSWDDATFVRCLGSTDRLREYAQKIQDILIEDYDSMLRGDKARCLSLRMSITECIPELIDEEGSWDFFNVGMFYTILCNLFPLLKIDVPKFRVRDGMRIIENIREATLSVSDYLQAPLDPLPADALLPNMVVWEAFDAPYVCFTNDGVIKRLNETGEERFQYQLDGGSRVRDKVFKHRAFGETILDGRYELVAVVMLEGVDSGGEGGTHYTCFYKTRESWVHFDDMKGISKIPALPEYALQEKNKKKPNFLIYKRI